jgi:PTH1 family peptidyl-tRNA hydrolase
MLLIAALGNPGPEYRRHRHNAGFMVAAELERRHGLGSFRAKFKGLVVEGRIAGQSVVLLMPQTYMNLSGESVGEAARFYRIPVTSILAVHDEVELPFGEVRLKEGQGLGGHNGLRSMEKVLGSRDFWRARLGVGRPPAGSRVPLADFLLSPFVESDWEVRELVEKGAGLVEEWLTAGGAVPAAERPPAMGPRRPAAPGAAGLPSGQAPAGALGPGSSAARGDSRPE